MGSSGSEEEDDAPASKLGAVVKQVSKLNQASKKANGNAVKSKEPNLEEDDKTSWVKDEVKVIGTDAKKKFKGLYKEKISNIKLRKSFYQDRALVYYLDYPESTYTAYEKLGIPLRILPPEESQDFRAAIQQDGNHVGVKLVVPHASSLVKITPFSYLKKFSVPLAKVSKTYKVLKQLMKDNGFILSQKKKFNFCWGFSKHRKQVYVIEV